MRVTDELYALDKRRRPAPELADVTTPASPHTPSEMRALRYGQFRATEEFLGQRRPHAGMHRGPVIGGSGASRKARDARKPCESKRAPDRRPSPPSTSWSNPWDQSFVSLLANTGSRDNPGRRRAWPKRIRSQAVWYSFVRPAHTAPTSAIGAHRILVRSRR